MTFKKECECEFLSRLVLFARLCYFKGDLNARKPTEGIFNLGKGVT